MYMINVIAGIYCILWSIIYYMGKRPASPLAPILSIIIGVAAIITEIYKDITNEKW